jgi:hypothetical protein
MSPTPEREMPPRQAASPNPLVVRRVEPDGSASTANDVKGRGQMFAVRSGRPRWLRRKQNVRYFSRAAAAFNFADKVSAATAAGPIVVEVYRCERGAWSRVER